MEENKDTIVELTLEEETQLEKIEQEELIEVPSVVNITFKEKKDGK